MLNKLLRHSAVYTLASVLTKGISVLLLPLYTRVLSPDDYGALDLLIVFGVLVNLIVVLEVSQAVARFWPDEMDTRGQYRLVSTAMWFSVGMYTVFVLGGWAFSEALCRAVLGDVKHLQALRIGLLFAAVNGVYLLLLSQFRWQLEPKKHAGISFLYAVCTLAFTYVVCFWLGYGVEGAVFALLMAATVSLLVAALMLRHLLKAVFDFDRLKQLLKFSMPLVPSALASFLMLYFNRWALNSFGDLSEVGVFAVANRVAALAGFFVVGVRGALTPLIYRDHALPNARHELARFFEWFSACALLGCLFLGMFAEELVVVLASDGYRSSWALIAVLAPATVLMQMYIFAPGMAIEKKTHLQLLVVASAALVSVVVNLILVPVYGGAGAAWASLLSAVAFFSSWVLVSQRYYRVPYAWTKCLWLLLAFAGVLGIYLLWRRNPLLPVNDWFLRVGLLGGFAATAFFVLRGAAAGDR